MSFYNNVFASAYLLYDKYESGARARATSFVYVSVVGAVTVLLALVKNFFKLDFSSMRESSYFVIVVVVMSLFILALFYRYYSANRVEAIIQCFTSKSYKAQWWWGAISIMQFVLSWVIAAVLLSK